MVPPAGRSGAPLDSVSMASIRKDLSGDGDTKLGAAGGVVGDVTKWDYTVVGGMDKVEWGRVFGEEFCGVELACFLIGDFLSKKVSL